MFPDTVILVWSTWSLEWEMNQNLLFFYFLTGGYQFGHKQQMSIIMHKCPRSHANTTIEVKMRLHEYL